MSSPAEAANTTGRTGPTFNAQAIIAPTYQPVADHRMAARARFFMFWSVGRQCRPANGTLVPAGSADWTGRRIDRSPDAPLERSPVRSVRQHRPYFRHGPFYPPGNFMLPPPRMRRSRHRSRGQSLAEFALVFPILMLIVGAIIQFGVIFWGQNSLNQVVRDAGRYAVTEPDCSAASATDVRAKITSIASSMGVAKVTGTPTVTMPTNGEVIGGTADPLSSTSVAGVNCPAKNNADHVWLRIQVDAQVPIFFPFVPGSGAISSTALFRMEPAP